MPGTYHDLTIDFIRTERQSAYQVAAHGHGDAREQFSLPPAAQDMLDRLQCEHPNLSDAELDQLGTLLFDALFHGLVRDVYQRRCESLPHNGRLRLVLKIGEDAPEIAQLPWEVLHDRATGSLALHGHSIVRHVPQLTPVLHPPAPKPLRVLLSTARTSPPANIEPELQLVREALAGLGQQVALIIERNLTVEKLQTRMRDGVHIWHHVGHGAVGPQGTVQLQLEDAYGDHAPIGADEVETLLAQSDLRLVVLDACQSGYIGGGLTGSMAYALVRAQVPAAIGMQLTIPTESARAFVSALYRALAEGHVVDRCVAEGRRAISVGPARGRTDWAAPVLYSRGAPLRLVTRHEATAELPRLSPGPALRQAPIRARQLVGRERILELARDTLSSQRKVLALYGAVGSGRDSVALVLCAELQRLGYIICPTPPWEHKPWTIKHLWSEIAVWLPAERRGIDQYPLQAIEANRRSGGRQDDIYRIEQHLRDTLERAPQQFALVIRIDRADQDLRDVILHLADQLHRTAMIIIDDREPGLTDTRRIRIEPLTLDQVRDLVAQEQIALDDDGVRAIYSVCHGLPGVLRHLLDMVTAHAGHEPQTLLAALGAGGGSEPALIYAERLRAELHEPVRAVLEIDALLGHAGIPLAEQPTLLDAAADVLGRTTSGKLVADYRRQTFHRYDGLVSLLRKAALTDLDARRAERHALLHQLAEHFATRPGSSSQFAAALLFAQAELWDRCAATLRALATSTELIYSSRCEDLQRLVEQVLDQPLLSADPTLRELAAACAAYLGRYDSSIDHLTNILATAAPESQLFARTAVQLMKACTEANKDDQALAAREKLLKQTAADNPLRALGLAHRGVCLIDAEQPQEAATILLDAIDSLEKCRSTWGEYRGLLEEERILLHDELARALAFSGDGAAALARLIAIRPDAQKLSTLNPRLLARIDNDLGLVYSHYGDTPDSPRLARAVFQQAFDLRQKIGDREGLLRVSQNLGNLQVELAPDHDAWRAAEELFERQLALVAKTEWARRHLIAANYADSLIDRGDLDRAQALLHGIVIDERVEESTRLILHINRAKLALWRDDPEHCWQELSQASQYKDEFGEDSDWIEWYQISLECRLRCGAAGDEERFNLTDAVARLADLEPPSDRRLADRARWLQARALAAAIRSDHQGALGRLDECQDLCAALKFHLRFARAAYWRAHMLARANDSRAPDALAEAERVLAPFGDTPLRRALAQLLARVPPGDSGELHARAHGE